MKLHFKELQNDEMEAPKKRYISLEERQQIIDELRLVPKRTCISRNYWWIKVSIKRKIRIFRRRQQIIDELRLVWQYNNGISKNSKFVRQRSCAQSTNKPSKFKTRNWIETNDDIRGAYSPNKQIRFKTTMLRSSLCDYSDAYILVKGNITVNNTAADGAAANNTNKKVIFKNCAPFTNCISKINNTQVDNAKDIDIVMPMYNLIEYRDNYSKTSGSL